MLVYTEPILDMKIENKMKSIVIPKEGLVLEPGKVYLGRTEEYTKTDNLVPMLEGRSSLARLASATTLSNLSVSILAIFISCIRVY